MKKRSKIIILVVLGIVLATVLMSGCIKKDECYEPGVPEDTYGFAYGFVVLAVVIVVTVSKIWRKSNRLDEQE